MVCFPFSHSLINIYLISKSVFVPSDCSSAVALSPGLDPRPLPCLTLVLTQRVSPPRFLSTRSYRSPHSRQSSVFISSMFLIRFFSLFTNGLFCLVVSHLLAPQASCAVALSISLGFLVSRLIFATLLYSLMSRATFGAMCSSSHILFVSRVFSYKVLLCSPGPREYFASSRCSHFAFLNSSGHFLRLSCFSSSPLRLASPTGDGQYLKSQGGATGYFVPIHRSPALATRCNRYLTVPTDHQRQRPGLPPMPSRLCATCQPSFDTAFWALLVSWLLLRLGDRISTPSPSMPPLLSRLCRLASEIIETLSRGRPDSAESLGTRP